MRYTLSVTMLCALLLLAACVPQQPTPTGDAVEPLELPPAPNDTGAVAPVVATPAQDTDLYTVTYTEGDRVKLAPVAIDPDGKEVTYSFTSPISPDGTWQTKIGDEGAYRVTVGASDGQSTTTETVLVVLTRANRPPVIDCGEGVSVKEGEDVDLHDACTVQDEDDTEVIVTYSGWMYGWRYTTTYDDAGDHVVRITASDKRQGEILHTVTQEVTIHVADVNRAPAFADSFPNQISAVENDVITLPAGSISDPDGDKVSVTYSTPFDANGVWRTKLGDAGAYDVDVVASDGTVSEKRTVHVSVGLLNTAPTLKAIKPIVIDEGETVSLPISATDREGDKLTVTVSGWMTDDTYKTTYDDAGEYTVKVTVTDGELETSQVVPITVRDVNRPPVFVTPA